MRQLKQATSSDLVAIQHVADTWEVDPKTIGKWTDIIYLAFDIRIPKVGPYPTWAVALLEICAKHISEKATLYFPETQEARRLKGNEFIKKIRHLRQGGHFQEFQQFQKFQNFQQQPDDQDDELETLVELAAIAETQDEQLFNAQQTFEAREDEQIEQLVGFIENSQQRRMGKLARRLRTRQLPTDTTADQTLDASFKRLN